MTQGVGMFGQRDDSNNSAQNQAGAPALPQMTPAGMPSSTITPTGPNPAAPGFMPSTIPAPEVPTSPSTATSTPITAPVSDAPSFSSASSDEVPSAEDLARMKQDALQHLQPLVGSLQQAPEEEFRTVMMMIQATDDKSLLKQALDAAKKIADDKVRAQAMLDVINEINYFAQTGEQE